MKRYQYSKIQQQLKESDQELTTKGKATLRRLLKKAERYDYHIGSDEIVDFADAKDLQPELIFQFMESNDIEIDRDVEGYEEHKYKPSQQLVRQYQPRIGRGGDCSKIINQIETETYFIPSQGG